MAVRFGVTIDCRNPSELASFWCRLLGFVEEPPPSGFQDWAEYDLAHGGRIIRESTSADDRFIVLADPEDNEFCLVL